MKRSSVHSALVACCLAAAAGSLQAQQSRLPVVTLTAGMNLIRAEVAARDADRQQGLMYREKMGANEGMVFVFDGPAQVCMWMKNTLIPLSVAFIDERGTIVNIEDMQPQTTDSHCARKPIRYALEMNQGWFRQKNIKPGMAIGGLPQ
ncbi:DUF192 domain-containing protein [Noviherbaspirillum aridicola]|nr:DUF192 domain-containing protein [Noviherbaspirillum aridicola]